MPFSGQELLCLSANPGLFMTSKKPGSALDAQHTTKLRISEWAFKSSHGQTWKAENNQKSSAPLLLLVLPSMWQISQNKHSWSRMAQLVRQADYQFVPADIRMSWWFLKRFGVTHTCLLWQREELEGSSHCRTLSKRKTNSFLMPDLFFFSSAFLLTPKVTCRMRSQQWSQSECTSWVNCSAVTHTEWFKFPTSSAVQFKKTIFPNFRH